jgi:hypothetical protein
MTLKGERESDTYRYGETKKFVLVSMDDARSSRDGQTIQPLLRPSDRFFEKIERSVFIE